MRIDDGGKVIRELPRLDCDLTGHRALVTGSSRGIGSAIALELGRAGADVYVHCSESSDKAEAVSRKIREMGRESSVKRANLCDTEAVKALCEELGDVDILVLNASLQIKKPWQDITAEEFSAQMSCNCLASLLLIQAAAGYMKRKNWGRIITIGSVQERKPHKDMLAYSASKCAQTGLVLSLAAQLAPCGITVNNVAPGVVFTDRNLSMLDDREYTASVFRSIPMGFIGEKEDMAGIVRLLCSDAGRYITGQSIFVDGGKSL